MFNEPLPDFEDMETTTLVTFMLYDLSFHDILASTKFHSIATTPEHEPSSSSVPGITSPSLIAWRGIAGKGSVIGRDVTHSKTLYVMVILTDLHLQSVMAV